MPQLARITRDPSVMGGKPCIRGMRVTVGTIVGLVAAGHSIADILREYPYLQAEDVSDGQPLLDWSRCPVVERVPERVSGAWVFRDTRLPVSVVFENLEAGATVDEISTWFDVPVDLARQVIEFAARSRRVSADAR